MIQVSVTAGKTSSQHFQQIEQALKKEEWKNQRMNVTSSVLQYTLPKNEYDFECESEIKNEFRQPAVKWQSEMYTTYSHYLKDDLPKD